MPGIKSLSADPVLEVCALPRERPSTLPRDRSLRIPHHQAMQTRELPPQYRGELHPPKKEICTSTPSDWGAASPQGSVTR
eukprot:1159877-Pelagomonas_calceolata.AAC.9